MSELFSATHTWMSGLLGLGGASGRKGFIAKHDFVSEIGLSGWTTRNRKPDPDEDARQNVQNKRDVDRVFEKLGLRLI